MSSVVVQTIYGGTGGGVASVNADTGPDVVLDNTDVGAAATAHTHTASNVSDFSTAADARIAAASIDALNDVTITSVATDNVLKWSGTAWVNGTGPATFPDNTFRIYDSTTPTKILAIELSGLVGTRTITGVNRDITLDTITTATAVSGFTTNGVFYAAGASINTRAWALFGGTDASPLMQLGINSGAGESGTGVNDHIYLYRNISGTPVEGTGIGIRFRGKSSSTINRDMGVMECVFKTTTDGSRQSRFDFYVYNVAVKTRMLRLELAGGIIIGADSANNTVIIPTAGNTNFWIGAAGLIKLVDNGGVPVIDINATGGTLKINGTQVVSARQTGWTAGIGTANIGAIDYDAVAFDATGYRALARRVYSLEAMLRTHGLMN